ncbi:MAG TPA: hypothetical protein VFG63_01580 [Nocardioidaceae bacterium]|nr:hypothetical protein [Nocardioidaceae bacterium]
MSMSLSMLVAGFAMAGSAFADQTNTTTVTTVSGPFNVPATADYYTVPASTAPVSTGIVLQPGQTVDISGSGTVDQCGGACPSTTPTDYLNAGVNGTFSQINADGTYTNTSGSAGTLTLGFADAYYAWDNTGAFQITVTFTSTLPCTPGKGTGDTNHLHCGAPGQLKKSA